MANPVTTEKKKTSASAKQTMQKETQAQKQTSLNEQKEKADAYRITTKSKNESAPTGGNDDKTVTKKQNKKNKTTDKTTTEQNIAGISQEELAQNHSQIIRDGLQTSILQLCEYEISNHPKMTKSCKTALTKVMDYSRLNKDKAELTLINSFLNKALLSIDASIKELEKNLTSNKLSAIEKNRYEDEHKFLGMMKNYLNQECNGTLEVPKDAIQIDATKNMTLFTTSSGMDSTVLTATQSVRWQSQKDTKLFPHQPTMNDIKQAYLGDCYFEAGLAALVNKDPSLITDCMKDNGDNTVTVRLYKRTVGSLGRIKNDTYRKIGLEDNIDILTDHELLFHLFLNYAGSNAYKHPDYYYHLAETLLQSSDPLFTDIIKRCREYADEKQNWSIYSINPSLFIDINNMFIDKNHPLYNQFANPQGPEEEALDEPFHAEYITVTKDIPVDQNGEPCYNKGPLWVHMMQKAYAASSFHEPEISPPDVYGTIRGFFNIVQYTAVKEINKEIPNASHEVKTKLIKQRIRDLTAKFKNSYNRISGGKINEVLERLTGKATSRHLINKPTALDLSDSISDLKRYTQKADAALPATEHIKVKDIPLYTNGLVQDLKKHTVKTTNTNPPQTYTLAAITIEDIKESIARMDKWDNTPTAYLDFKNSLPEHLNEQEKAAMISKYKNDLAEWLEHYFEEETTNRYHIQHRRFTTKEVDGEQVACYTKSALQEYDRIKQALEEGKPIGIGTCRFLPEGVSASGLNGEAQNAGIAEGHAYTLLKCEENATSGIKYIWLRNPWNMGEMSYDKTTTTDSNGNVTNTSTSSKRMDKQGGVFRFELNDFMNRVNFVHGF